MNDFTKEELEDMYEAVTDTSVAMPHYLPKKIQDLIYSYCDHAWAYYFSCDGSDVKCQKCHRKLHDNQ